MIIIPTSPKLKSGHHITRLSNINTPVLNRDQTR